MTAGYSKRALPDKLGIKPGARMLLVNPPEGYQRALGPLPTGVTLMDRPEPPLDVIHLFTRSRADLEARFPALKAALAPDGMLWVSWPKRTSGIPTDLTETVVRRVGLACGLVDVKAAAVDRTWSGLKFVYRLKDRP